MIEAFSYIRLPAVTGKLQDDVAALFCLNDRPNTLMHSRAVAGTAGEIAARYGLDRTACEISGWLHDISCIIKPEDMLAYAREHKMETDEAEEKYPFLLHQRMSRIAAESFFKITDPRILSAVACHTTLKAAPSAYDMALFLADKLSWDQNGIPPYYDAVWDALQQSLEKASLLYMEYIVDQKMILYPHAWFLEAMDGLRREAAGE